MNRILSYIRWYLSARTAYSLHSPMLYAFCEKVLEDNRWYYAFDILENTRGLAHPTIIEQGDTQNPDSSVDAHLRTLGFQKKTKSALPLIQRQMLFRLAIWWQPQQIIVLGDDIGLQTAYLGYANTTTPIVTLSLIIPHLDFMHLPQKVRTLLYINTTSYSTDQITEILDYLSGSGHRPWLVIFNSISHSGERYKAWKTWSDGRYGGAWIDLYHTGIWIADEAFIKPVAIGLIQRQYKPFRLGWI